MFDTIKKYYNLAIGWVVAGLLLALYLMRESNNKIRGKLGQAEAEKDLRESLLKGEQDEKDAQDATDDYNAMRSNYLKLHSEQQGKSGPEGDDEPPKTA